MKAPCLTYAGNAEECECRRVYDAVSAVPLKIKILRRMAMALPRFYRPWVLALFFLVFTCLASAQPQQGAGGYQPEEGQSGKDVVWIPTEDVLVDIMLNMANVTGKDYVVDLGSGDGRLVIAAAKRGARALGVEYNPQMVELSKKNAVLHGVADKVQFIHADLFDVDFSQATVVTMFLLDELNLKLRPRLLDMKPGTRVVSNTFMMGEWKPDQIGSVPAERKCAYYCFASLWIVPAKVEGTWKLGSRELTLEQRFQMISGELKSGARVEPIKEGVLKGDQISFIAGETHYTGRVDGNRMQGKLTSGKKSTGWSAQRVGYALK